MRGADTPSTHQLARIPGQPARHCSQYACTRARAQAELITDVYLVIATTTAERPRPSAATHGRRGEVRYDRGVIGLGHGASAWPRLLAASHASPFTRLERKSLEPEERRLLLTGRLPS